MAMQYIDAAMVGSLGAKASASIGLVSTSTWLMGGLCISVATGFSVQAAHLIGAERRRRRSMSFARHFPQRLWWGSSCVR